MPVHDLGYRPWVGERVGPLGRWWSIVATGVRLAWKSKLLKRLLILAWIPVLYVAGILVVMEWVMLQQGPAAAIGILPLIVDGPAEIARLSALALSDPAAFRGELWTRLIHLYFRVPQPILMALIVGIVAPPLISRDLRSRAWLLYFSRPIRRIGYLTGKWGVVVVFLLSITTLPALMVYLLGVGLSPTQEATLTTWMLPIRVLGASVVLIVPTTVLAVWFSSLWYNSRTSTFAWYAMWLLGAIVFNILSAVTGEMGQAIAQGEGGGAPGAPLLERNPAFILLSFYHMLASVQGWIFGAGPRTAAVNLALVGLALITLGAAALTFRRISAPMRI